MHLLNQKQVILYIRCVTTSYGVLSIGQQTQMMKGLVYRLMQILEQSSQLNKNEEHEKMYDEMTKIKQQQSEVKDDKSVDVSNINKSG